MERVIEILNNYFTFGSALGSDCRFHRCPCALNRSIMVPLLWGVCLCHMLFAEHMPWLTCSYSGLQRFDGESQLRSSQMTGGLIKSQQVQHQCVAAQGCSHDEM